MHDTAWCTSVAHFRVLRVPSSELYAPLEEMRRLFSPSRGLLSFFSTLDDDLLRSDFAIFFCRRRCCSSRCLGNTSRERLKNSTASSSSSVGFVAGLGAGLLKSDLFFGGGGAGDSANGSEMSSMSICDDLRFEIGGEYIFVPGEE
jgi:hypothetical protein